MSLVNSRPWVFIPSESVLDDDDFLADQQLQQDMTRGRPPKQALEPASIKAANIVNALALKGTAKGSTTPTGPKKRKREEHAAEQRPPSKRVAEGKASKSTREGIAKSRRAEKASYKTLPRSSGVQETRHMIQTYPEIKKKKRDLWEVSPDPAEPSEDAAVAQVSIDTSQHEGAGGSAKRSRNLRSTTKAAVPAEGHSSAILNGRVHVTENPGRGKPKTKKTSKNSGRATQSYHGDDATQKPENAHVEGHSSGQGGLLDHMDTDESFHPETDTNDDYDPPTFDLLGYETEWQKILEAARSVGGSRLPKNQMPTLQTETIKALISDIRKARTLYENRSYDEPVDHLHELLDVIEAQIKHDDISEAKAFTKRTVMIRDIYARAIPALVFLLESAISFHALHWKGLRCYEALQEVVSLQEMMLSLCLKAKIWKAKPNTDKPIRKPTTAVIFPYTRDMKKIFERELTEQRRKWKIKQNALKSAESGKEAMEKSQRHRVESTTEAIDRVARGLSCIERARADLRSSRKQMGSLGLQSSQENGAPRPNTKWTAEEEKELMRQLQSGYVRGQTAEDRYLAILNARPLQNKLPEHIREQALELKEYLKREWGQCEWIESIR